MTSSTLTETFATPAEGLKAAVPLNHGGVSMPWLGLGVYQMSNDNSTVQLIRKAIEHGYRSVDTAKIYGNERSVGEAVRTCGVPREELFITTKVWNDDMRNNRVEAAFDASLRLLGMHYVDLYLLHWPIKGKLVSSWKALEKLQRSGRVKAIGVSNYLRPHLDELLGAAEIIPAVNQIEYHPYLQSQALVEFCVSQGIRVECWSPLMQAGEVMKDPVLVRLAEKYDKTVPQIILRWDIQGGLVTIPKSSRESRVIENSNIFDFALTDEEMAEISTLDRGRRTGPNPMTFGS